MEKEPFNDLSPAFQARLNKWRANVLSVKSADILRGKSPVKCRPVRGDYGDDISDFEELNKRGNQ